jgi:hypothetical protein
MHSFESLMKPSGTESPKTYIICFLSRCLFAVFTGCSCACLSSTGQYDTNQCHSRVLLITSYLFQDEVTHTKS